MTAIVTPSVNPALPSSLAGTSGRLLRLLSPLPSIDIFLPDDPERYRLTDYIAEQFKFAHGASVHDFMPLLLGMSCQGQFSAVSGMRPATRHPLFLEQYLGQPVEAVLSQLSESQVERGKIMEVGNLVATRSGASQLLFLLLAAMLYRVNFEWVVFTGTPVVIKGLERLGFKLEKLADADPAKLTSSRLSDWGRYYEQRPQVVAGNITEGIRVLSEHKLYTAALALFEPTIRQMAKAFRASDLPYGTHAIRA